MEEESAEAERSEAAAKITAPETKSNLRPKRSPILPSVMSSAAKTRA